MIRNEFCPESLNIQDACNNLDIGNSPEEKNNTENNEDIRNNPEFGKHKNNLDTSSPHQTNLIETGKCPDNKSGPQISTSEAGRGTILPVFVTCKSPVEVLDYSDTLDTLYLGKFRYLLNDVYLHARYNFTHALDYIRYELGICFFVEYRMIPDKLLST